ncbi:LegC family aminotransferase [uncultured Desulfosarcina sp.]|uniref:LegC family aminotransferase n=1 Tax=uncultured Desulfosarcina sp. TaxID=218289 RepID=UPI0029C6384B|nr:LegC family aminotransferase [uncultured Desulfosarcina sp.]
MYNKVIAFIRELYHGKEFIPLHEPVFDETEIDYVNRTIQSTFVSSVGEYVDLFEKKLCQITGSKYAIATVNGTAALHVALKLAGVEPDDEVITQPLSFVATANAIRYCGAHPVFLDIDIKTLGLSANCVEKFLSENCRYDGNTTFNRHTNRRVVACVPMHTFGHPCRIDDIAEICNRYHIPIVEDAAEAIGSIYQGKHAGTFGKCGILSFNGNKTITCGGGGAVITNDKTLAIAAKHLTTTAKVPGGFEYVHDTLGFNYRLPNINAALGCGQLEKLNVFVRYKRRLSEKYERFFSSVDLPFVKEPRDAVSNYWLNAVILPTLNERNRFLKKTNDNGVTTRPAWRLLNKLPMYQTCETDSLVNANWIADRLVNIPSSVVT